MTNSDEYNGLRLELAENKKYVFERPLITISAGFAAFAIVGKDYWWFIPPVIIFLLLFSLKFTINRMESSARIVAYIQLFLEREGAPFGWERFLRLYRIVDNLLSKKNYHSLSKQIEIQIETQLEKYTPRNFGYYPIVRDFHLFSGLLCMVGSILLCIGCFELEETIFIPVHFLVEFNVSQFILNSLGLIFSSIVFYLLLNVVKKYSKNEMSKLIEKKRIFIMVGICNLIDREKDLYGNDDKIVEKLVQHLKKIGMEIKHDEGNKKERKEEVLE